MASCSTTNKAFVFVLDAEQNENQSSVTHGKTEPETKNKSTV